MALWMWMVDGLDSGYPFRLLREEILAGWNLFCSAPSPNNVICTTRSSSTRA